jgi:predicted HicB family RNase H-like nuclease
MQGIINLVKEVVDDMKANDETVPIPLSEKHYSGKFQVRIPPEQHRNLAMIASEQGISLNRYISSKLSG